MNRMLVTVEMPETGGARVITEIDSLKEPLEAAFWAVRSLGGEPVPGARVIAGPFAFDVIDVDEARETVTLRPVGFADGRAFDWGTDDPT